MLEMLGEQPKIGKDEEIPRISIIVASDRVDKLFPAATLESTAAIMNREELFSTTWGLLALKRESEASEISADYEGHEEELRRAVSIPGWKEILQEVGRTGSLRVYACSTTMDLFGLKAEGFIEMVDEIVGAAYSLGRAKASEVSLSIS